MRSLLNVLALLILCSPRNHASQLNPVGQRVPSFAVATIRPSKPDEPQRIQIVGHRFSTGGTSLVDILKYAYGIHASQITGGPDWFRTEKFDLLADPETEGRPASDLMKKMVQQLIAERFHLSLRHDRRELPVYAIVVGKTGPKLTKSTRDDPNGIPSVGFDSRGELGAGNATMSDFATFLQRYVLDRPVVDQTGITGRYDINLRWTPDETSSNVAANPRMEDAEAPPGLYTAVQEQLGLKLSSTKAYVDVVVVDHVEQPSEN